MARESSQSAFGLARALAPGAVLALLLQLLADARALELGQVVDEQLAIEMIDLVLDAYREQAVRSNSICLPSRSSARTRIVLGARDLVIDAGHRQAAFLCFLDASRSRISGLISARRSLRFSLTSITSSALVHVHLRGREADARARRTWSRTCRR